MRNLFKPLLKGEEGSTLVLVALGMAVLLASMAMVTDVGLLYLERTKMVNALDAAVLAGTQELPGNPVKAREVALQYISQNGIDPAVVEVTTGIDNRSLTLKGKSSVNLFFARVFGANTREISATSKGVIGAIRGMTGVVPLSIQEQPLVFGQEYILKTGTGDTGWFGPVSLGGNGASVYLLNLQQGYSGYLKVGDSIPTEPGNMSGPTEQGLEYRINQDPHYPKCTPANYRRSCPRVVYLPVVSPPAGGGKSTVVIKGFAAFLVSDAEIGQGNESIVRGYFLEEIAPGDIDESASDYGLTGVKLVE